MRELENVMQRALILCDGVSVKPENLILDDFDGAYGTRTTIAADGLSPHLYQEQQFTAPAAPQPTVPTSLQPNAFQPTPQRSAGGYNAAFNPAAAGYSGAQPAGGLAQPQGSMAQPQSFTPNGFNAPGLAAGGAMSQNMPQSLPPNPNFTPVRGVTGHSAAESVASTMDRVRHQKLPTSLGGELKQQEYQIILDALIDCRGNRQAVAEKLGISPRTLRYKIAKMREEGMIIPS